MESKPAVLLFVTKVREEEKRIVEFLRHDGADVEIISEQSSWNVQDVKHYDIALVRCLSQSTALARARYIEAAGVKAINSRHAIEICTDKGLQSVFLPGMKSRCPPGGLFIITAISTNYCRSLVTAL